MTLKIFYDKTTWRGFYPPEKPERPTDTFCMTFYMIDMRNYEQAYALAKRNAMEIGNPAILEELPRLLNKHYIDVVKEVHGKESYIWPFSSEIKDGKIFLSV